MRFANPSKKTRTLSSLKGHHIEFPGRVAVDAKGKPVDYTPPEGGAVNGEGLVFVHVPPILYQECMNSGWLEAEEGFQEPDEPTVPQRPADPLKFESELFAAFDTLVETNPREAFAGSGLPKGDAIEKLLGWAVTNAEIKDAWPKYLKSKKD